jgi:putative transposase
MERYRFHSDGVLFYVTFSVVDWLPIFVSETACKIETESLNFCHRQKGLRVNAYVIMPTHLHAILFHADFQAKALDRAQRRGQETRAEREDQLPSAPKT